ncbi:Imm6 family immunity protein [Pseudomonas pergaminensis]
MDNKQVLALVNDLPWTQKATIFLRVIDHVLNSFSTQVATQEKCREAVKLCWSWLQDHSVEPDRLAYYLDSEEMQDGPLAEHLFVEGSLEQDSLILVLLVVGFFAHEAYKQAGRSKEMSAAITEADEGAAEYIVDYIGRVGLVDKLSTYL